MRNPPSSAAPAAGVQVVRKDARFELLRNGAPYLVKGGGGGENALESLAKAGGNSIRLWGDDHLGDMLDRAQKLGLGTFIFIRLFSMHATPNLPRRFATPRNSMSCCLPAAPS